MKKVTIKILLLALPVCAALSCKPTLKVTTDYDHAADFSTYKTFGMYYLVTSKNINQLNEERIWNAIRMEMIKKGYKEDNHNPDLVVNAVSVLKDKKYLTASPGLAGALIAHPYGYLASRAMISGPSIIQAYDYTNGSLKIDVVDAKNDRLIWEGTGTADIDKQPKNPEEVINKTVSKILSDFPAGTEKM